MTFNILETSYCQFSPIRLCHLEIEHYPILGNNIVRDYFRVSCYLPNNFDGQHLDFLDLCSEIIDNRGH